MDKHVEDLPKAKSLKESYESFPGCCRECDIPSVNYLDFCEGRLVVLTCPHWATCKRKEEPDGR